MIALHPAPESRHPHTCPDCAVGLEVRGWYIPGMRNLADLVCRRCAREFYGDLPSGHGLYMPILLDRESRRMYDRHEGAWFAGWLRESYARRGAEPLGFAVEEIRPLRDAVLLLPSAHARAVVELMPDGRWGNLLHDLLLRSGDARETLWRIRVLPTSVSAEELASCVSSLLRQHLGLLLGMGRDWCDHGRVQDPTAWSRAMLARVAGATGP